MSAPTTIVLSTQSEVSLSSENSKGSRPETSPSAGVVEAAQVTPPQSGSKPRSRVQDIIKKIEQGQIKGHSPEKPSEYASLKIRSRVTSIDSQNSFRRSPTEKEDRKGEAGVNVTNSSTPKTPSPVRKFTPTTPPAPPPSPISPYVDQDDLGLLEQKLFFAESPLSKYLDKANDAKLSTTTVRNVTVTRESFPMRGSAGSETGTGLVSSWSSIFKALPLSPVDKPLPSLPGEHDIFEDSPTKCPSHTAALALVGLSQKAVTFADADAQADEVAAAAAEQPDPAAAAAEWRDIRSYLWADMDADDNPHSPQPATSELREKIEGRPQSPDDPEAKMDVTDMDPSDMKGDGPSPAPVPMHHGGHEHEDPSDMTDEELAACMALLRMSRGGEAQPAWTPVRPRRPTISRERMAEIDAYIEASPARR